MKAMILAAGRGTRMGRLTDLTPKPLLPLAGMPLIEYHIRSLAAAGFDELVINTAWLADQIETSLGNGKRFGVFIEYSREPEGALETAGGIARALPMLGPDPFAVVNADIWTDFPLHMLRDVLNSSGSPDDRAHIVMVPNPEHNPAGDFRFRSDSTAGAFRHGRLIGGQESDHDENRRERAPEHPASRYTFSGIGVYRPDAFGAIRGRAPLGPLLKQWIAEDLVSATVFDGHWWDVGTPERLALVERFLRGPG